MSNKIVTFGEMMLRLSPPDHKRFIQCDSFDVVYGGGEANVALSLANYGAESFYVTKVPNNELGRAAINELRRYGVNTEYITLGGERLGIYFLEIGASQRPSKVLYDRSYSAIAQATTEDFDWEQIFSGKDWFHFTGITPALSDNCAEITMVAAKTAKRMGLQVSCDINYRKKLWTPDKAKRVMTSLMKYVDVVVGNEEDAEKVFGITAKGSDITAGKLQTEGYKEVAKTLVDRFALKMAAITLRESFSASDNGWSGIVYNGKEFAQSKKYEVHIVDRVGGGDAFASGLIYAMLNKYSLEDTVNFAAAASCLKHTIPGDFNLCTIAEVKALMQGDGSGRVVR